MKNPIEDEKFNKLFHITHKLVKLVKKLDDSKTQQGYLEEAEQDIDKLFLDKTTGENNGSD
jgi:hypothetical protein